MSLEDQYFNSTEEVSDVRELIPEMFFIQINLGFVFLKPISISIT